MTLNEHVEKALEIMYGDSTEYGKPEDAAAFAIIGLAVELQNTNELQNKRITLQIQQNRLLERIAVALERSTAIQEIHLEDYDTDYEEPRPEAD